MCVTYILRSSHERSEALVVGYVEIDAYTERYKDDACTDDDDHYYDDNDDCNDVRENSQS